MSQHKIDQLLGIMAKLRAPEGGCPWDLEQDFASIAPYTIEEAYEVADAIARGDMAHLKEELGDLLLQVVFHAQMASEGRAVHLRGCRGQHQRQNDPPPPRMYSPMRRLLPPKRKPRTGK